MATTPCVARHRLPQSFINLMKSRLESPTGRWNDYNPDYRHYQVLLDAIKLGLICESDLPDIPNTDDYNDLDAPRTRN